MRKSTCCETFPHSTRVVMLEVGWEGVYCNGNGAGSSLFPNKTEMKREK